MNLCESRNRNKDAENKCMERETNWETWIGIHTNIYKTMYKADN